MKYFLNQNQHNLKEINQEYIIRDIHSNKINN